MRKFFALLLCLAVVMPSFALDKSKSRFGVHLSGGYAASKKSSYIVHGGFDAGVGLLVHLHLNEKLALEPEFNVVASRVSINGIEGGEVHYQYDGRLDYALLTAALNLSVTPVKIKKVKISVFTGPRFNNMLTSKLKYTETNPQVPGSIVEYTDAKPTTAAISVDWCVGLSAVYKKFYTRVNFGTGITNIATLPLRTEVALQQISANLGIGVFF